MKNFHVALRDYQVSESKTWPEKHRNELLIFQETKTNEMILSKFFSKIRD